MTRTEITKELSLLVEKHINPKNDARIYWAKEVTFDYATGHAIRVDYMQFKPLNNSVSGLEKGDFLCFEIKSCVDDFHSKNGHNFIGDLNYYVMPQDVYDAVRQEIGYYVGVYVPDDSGGLKCVKCARRHDRAYSVLETLFMMFRSANRDRLKGLAKDD